MRTSYRVNKKNTSEEAESWLTDGHILECTALR